MTLFLPQRNFFFATIPKVACTSLKQLFFRIENDREFQSFRVNSKIRHIHHLYKAMLFKDYPEPSKLEDCYKVTMIRDPLKRFLSAYSNRVTFHNELSIQKSGPGLEKLGLKPDPDIHTFIEHFDGYKAAHNSIFHHTRPMIDFIGTDPQFFDRVYDMPDIEALRLDIVARLGKDYPMPHAQKGGQKVDPASLSAAEISKIRNIYAQDYDVWGSHLKT